MSERPKGGRREAAGNNAYDENEDATALGLAAVNFFRIFVVTILREGLLPGFILTPLGRNSNTSDDDAIGEIHQDYNRETLNVNQQVIVPNYCSSSSSTGPFYTVTRGFRVGIYNDPLDALRGSAGVSRASAGAFLTELDARRAFVEAWIRGEVFEMRSSNAAMSETSQTDILAPDSEPEGSSQSIIADETKDNISTGDSSRNTDDTIFDSDTECSETIEGEQTELSFGAAQGSSSYVEAQLNTEDSIEI